MSVHWQLSLPPPCAPAATALTSLGEENFPASPLRSQRNWERGVGGVWRPTARRVGSLGNRQDTWSKPGEDVGNPSKPAPSGSTNLSCTKHASLSGPAFVKRLGGGRPEKALGTPHPHAFQKGSCTVEGGRGRTVGSGGYRGARKRRSDPPITGREATAVGGERPGRGLLGENP